MIRWLLPLLCLLLVPPARAGDWRDTLTSPQPGKFSPLRPQKAVYRFGWGGITAAEATFSFSKPRGLYQLEMNTQTTGFVRTLWKMDSQHTATCNATTLRPIRLQQIEAYKSETETTKTEFSPEGARRTTQVTPAKGPPDKEHKFKCANVFDLLSALLFVRSQPLQQGDKYRMVVFPSKAGYLTDIEVIGREKLKVPAGSYNAIKCQVRLQGITKHMELEPHKKFKRAFAWLSDDRDRVLLKIEAEIFVGSVWTELQSVEFPQ